MASKTELHSLTMKLEGGTEKFQETYNDVFINRSKKNNLLEVKPVQVILDSVTGYCTIYLLRNPKIKSYQFKQYVFDVAQDLKAEYNLSSVIMKVRNFFVDPENFPNTLKLNVKEAEEIAKRAMEDDMFSEKYKEHIVRKSQLQIQQERDARDAAAAEAFASKINKEQPVNSIKVVLEKPEDISIEKEMSEADAKAAVNNFTFKMEKNGQLCLIF